ncbi:MAG: glycosyltransferase, partial [bacterium]|nr:glycosyltransferase [bacterium]
MHVARTPRPPRRPIRLVHCIGTMRLGGAETQLAELICRLPRDRFAQSLVLLQGGASLREGRYLIDKVRQAGCPVISLRYSMQFHWYDPRSWAAAAWALLRYVAHLLRRRPDIVHAQLYWANIISVLAGRLAFVPRIVTSRLQLSDYKAGRPAMQRIENWANRFTDAVFVNSEAVRQDVMSHEDHVPARVQLIYNGVVVDRFQQADPDPLRRELDLAGDEFVI